MRGDILLLLLLLLCVDLGVVVFTTSTICIGLTSKFFSPPPCTIVENAHGSTTSNSETKINIAICVAEDLVTSPEMTEEFG